MTPHSPEETPTGTAGGPPADAPWYFEVTEPVEEFDLRPGMTVRWDPGNPDTGAIVYETRQITPVSVLGLHDLGKLRVKHGSPPTALLRRFYPHPEPGAEPRLPDPPPDHQPSARRRRPRGQPKAGRSTAQLRLMRPDE